MQILLVDDHLIVRQGLKHFVESALESTAVEACSGNEFLKKTQQNTYDVIFIGQTISTTDPIEMTKQIRAERPDLPVLVLSILDDEQYCGRLLRAGASGILTRESATNELPEALERIFRGRKYISPSLAEKLTDIPPDADTSLSDTLSDREYEVMVSLSKGKRIKQIADEMSLSIKTVSTYHSRILQ